MQYGYFPDVIPPILYSNKVADFFSKHDCDSISIKKEKYETIPYNASKRRISRREFQVIHPLVAYRLSKLVATHWKGINKHFGKIDYSLSKPDKNEKGRRALITKPHKEVEQIKYEKLAPYPFILQVDISRFFYSIYTHSLYWAVSGKREKAPRDNFYNHADFLIRKSQMEQSIGIPVGPDISKVFSEIVAIGIDLKFKKYNKIKDIEVLRYVDDYWIGVKDRSDIDKSYINITKAIRFFKLDVNENKTNIYEGNFVTSTQWKNKLTYEIKQSMADKDAEGLRSALEGVFQYAYSKKDDGVLKYYIKYFSNGAILCTFWNVIEPFLMKSVIHFGHTIPEFVQLMILKTSTDEEAQTSDKWSSIIDYLLFKHGELGHDNEVCWLLFLCKYLNIKIDNEIAKKIIESTNTFSILFLFHYIMDNADYYKGLYESAKEMLASQTSESQYWPLILQWKVQKWPYHKTIEVNDACIDEMIKESVFIFNEDVFQSNDIASTFNNIISGYSDDTPDDEPF